PRALLCGIETDLHKQGACVVLIATKLTLVVQTEGGALAGFQFGAQFGNSGILGDRCAADAEGAARQGGKGQFTVGCGVTQGMTPAQASAQGQRGFRQVQLGGAAQSQCDGTQVLALRVATQSGLATRFAKGAVTQLMPVHAGIGFYAGA